jgi:hypothetical protein
MAGFREDFNIEPILATMPKVFEFGSKEEHMAWVDANFDKLVSFFEKKNIELTAENLVKYKVELADYMQNPESLKVDEGIMAEFRKESKVTKAVSLVVMIVIVYLIFR